MRLQSPDFDQEYVMSKARHENPNGDPSVDPHRSWMMSRVKGKNTKPEIKVRAMLHGMGLRFTVNGPLNRDLPGKPDIVLPKYRTVVFVHGCFWHAHPGCKDFRIPKTRREWWEAKLYGNRERDLRNQAALLTRNWTVRVVWTCQLRNRATLGELAGTLESWFSDLEPELKVAETPAPYSTGPNSSG